MFCSLFTAPRLQHLLAHQHRGLRPAGALGLVRNRLPVPLGRPRCSRMWTRSLGGRGDRVGGNTDAWAAKECVEEYRDGREGEDTGACEGYTGHVYAMVSRWCWLLETIDMVCTVKIIWFNHENMRYGLLQGLLVDVIFVY